MRATTIQMLDHAGSCDICRDDKGMGWTERQYLVVLTDGTRLTLCPAHSAGAELV